MKKWRWWNCWVPFEKIVLNRGTTHKRSWDSCWFLPSCFSRLPTMPVNDVCLMRESSTKISTNNAIQAMHRQQRTRHQPSTHETHWSPGRLHPSIQVIRALPKKHGIASKWHNDFCFHPKLSGNISRFFLSQSWWSISMSIDTLWETNLEVQNCYFLWTKNQLPA